MGEALTREQRKQRREAPRRDEIGDRWEESGGRAALLQIEDLRLDLMV